MPELSELDGWGRVEEGRGAIDFYVLADHWSRHKMQNL